MEQRAGDVGTCSTPRLTVTVGVLGTLDELQRLSSGHGYREERLRRMLADHEPQVQAVTAATWRHD